MKKLFKIAFVFVLLSGCSTNRKLDENFDKDEIIKQGIAEVEIINTRDYEAIVLSIKEELQADIKAEDLEKAWDEQLVKLGAFKECPNTQVIGTLNTETNEELATIALECKYENGKAIFTLTYDQALDLVGLYLK